MEQRFDRLDQRIDDRFDKIDSRFGWLIGLLFAMVTATVGALLQR
jgi:hypothetical protein